MKNTIELIHKLLVRLNPYAGCSIPVLYPNGHFYSPVIDPRDLRVMEAKIWAEEKDMLGVDMRETEQLGLLKKLVTYVKQIEYPIKKPADPTVYYYSNDQFPMLDAEVLFAFLNHFRPQRMIEIGSGFSSLVVADINRRIYQGSLDFTCIEPYPRQFMLNGVDGISQVVQERLERVDLGVFEALEDGDFLFVDSSHVAKTGSDVNFLFFKILPRIKPGVLIHLHDIFLPDEYPRNWVMEDGRNWNEQYLLHAFLEFNSAFEVVWASHYLAKYHKDAVESVFPRFPKLGGGGSFWLRRVE